LNPTKRIIDEKLAAQCKKQMSVSVDIVNRCEMTYRSGKTVLHNK